MPLFIMWQSVQPYFTVWVVDRSGSPVADAAVRVVSSSGNVVSDQSVEGGETYLQFKTKPALGEIFTRLHDDRQG